jgi:hypothetical protein
MKKVMATLNTGIEYIVVIMVILVVIIVVYLNPEKK